MSLINNMLKELENRNKNQREIPAIPLLIPKQTSRFQLMNFSFIQKKIFYLSFFIASLIVAFCTIFLSSREITKLKPILPAQYFDHQISLQSDVFWQQKIDISGISFQVKENVTEISFFLSHPTLYRVFTDGFKNQIILILENSELKSQLPSFSNTNTALQQIKIQKLGSDIGFVMSLIPGSEIKYLNLTQEKQNNEIVIAIKNNSINKTNDIGSQAIKTEAIDSLSSQKYQQALDLAKRNNTISAIQLLTAILKNNPTFIQARISLIALLLNEKQLQFANQYINEGLNLHPNVIALIELRARLLTITGKVKEALQILQSTAPAMEENPEYHAFMATLYERTNNDSLAVNVYRNLLSLNSKNSGWWLGLGVSLEKINKPKEALSAYSHALREGQLSSESIAFLQNRLQKLEEITNAKE